MSSRVPELTQQQFYLTTQDDERNYFTGDQEGSIDFDSNAILPAGRYRIILGQLYRVVHGLPPALMKEMFE